MKKAAKYILFPFVLLWIAIAYCIMRTGDGLHWLGNYMSGYRLDKSIGQVYVE